MTLCHRSAKHCIPLYKNDPIFESTNVSIFYLVETSDNQSMFYIVIFWSHKCLVEKHSALIVHLHGNTRSHTKNLFWSVLLHPNHINQPIITVFDNENKIQVFAENIFPIKSNFIQNVPKNSLISGNKFEFTTIVIISGLVC